MKKFLTMLLVGIMSSVLLTTPAGAYSSSEMPNALLLFVGTNSSYSWSPYPSYSNNDLDKILDATKEFVIINSNATYNYYQKNGTATQIVSNSSINAIQSSDVQYANKLADVKEDYFGLLSSVGSYSSVTLDKSVSAQVALAKQIISKEPNATIWFSFPMVTFQACAQYYKEPFTYMFNQIKSQIGTTAWNKNVRGFYWGTEAVTSYYTKFDEGAAGNYYNNRMIQLMADIGNLVHNNNKQFMWIPYNTKDTQTSSLYTFIRAGYVANKTNIFDYVIIQPGYYQNSDMLNQLDYALHPTEDKIEIAYPKEEIPFSRTDNGVPTSAQIYSLPENDKTMVDYTVYMGGDIGETIIETSRPSLRKALIVGDSFTTPLETLLWMSFDETRSLDYRHYSEKNLLDYIKEYQPDVVITVRDESVYLSQEGNGAIS